LPKQGNPWHKIKARGDRVQVKAQTRETARCRDRGKTPQVSRVRGSQAAEEAPRQIPYLPEPVKDRLVARRATPLLLSPANSRDRSTPPGSEVKPAIMSYSSPERTPVRARLRQLKDSLPFQGRPDRLWCHIRKSITHIFERLIKP
jgi:hypothetical protein